MQEYMERLVAPPGRLQQPQKKKNSFHISITAIGILRDTCREEEKKLIFFCRLKKSFFFYIFVIVIKWIKKSGRTGCCVRHGVQQQGEKKKRWFNKQPNKTADRRRHGPHHVKDESIDVCRIETCLGRLHRWRLSRLISFSSPLNVGGILFQQHKYITRKTLRCCGMIRSFLELQDAAGSFFSRNIVLLK